MDHDENDMSTIRRALRYAEEKHRGEVRKGTEASPYILHPTAAALLVAMCGAPIQVIVAVILHDTVEDTDATIEEIRDLFGAKVADIVAALTKPKGPKLSAAEVSNRLMTIDEVVAKAADLTVNLGDVVDDARINGAGHLRLLFKDPVAKLDSYIGLARILAARLCAPKDAPDYVVAMGVRLSKLEPQAREIRDLLAR